MLSENVKMSRNLDFIYIVTLIFIYGPLKTECQCTFPGTFIGTWTTSGQGTWIINSTHIQNYETISDSGVYLSGQGDTITSMTMMCLENRGDTKYTLQSEAFEYFAGVFITAQVCIDFEEITSSKYVFYKATTPDPSGHQWTLSTDYNGICDDTNYKLPYRYRMALKSGSETTALTTCPSSLFGSFHYDTCTDPSSDTSVSTCDTRQQLIYNYTLCPDTQMFSVEGVLDCVYFLSSGSTTYLTMYNRDSTPPNMVSTYRFVCLALVQTGNNVNMTINPQRCAENQDPLTISSPGYAVYFTSYSTCAALNTATSDEDSSLAGWAIVLIVLPCLLILVVAGAIIGYHIMKRQKRRVGSKKDRQPGRGSVTDVDSNINRTKLHESTDVNVNVRFTRSAHVRAFAPTSVGPGACGE